MSWVTGKISPVELDNKIAEATSESIPNGELELSIALEITDVIRSKKIPAKQCMRALKKRLTLIYSNPNLMKSTLKLIDLCVKNSGFHFLVEIASKEFMDYLVDFILLVHYNVKERNVKNNEAKLSVGNLILSLVKEWSIVFGNQLQLNYVEKVYNELVNQGFEFPELSGHVQQMTSTFVDSEVPPDWVDSDSCMICYTPFSMINRKHHCRACGGVYCQTHSANNTPLVQLGIMEAVRVCDNCLAKQKAKTSKNKPSHERSSSRSIQNEALDDEEEQIRRAIELSLQDSSIPSAPRHEPPQAPPPTQEADDEDEEMKAAIAASLREYESEKVAHQSHQQFQQPEQQQQPPTQPESDLYNFSIPTSNSQQNQYPQYGAPQPQFQQQAPPQQMLQPPVQEDLSQAEEEQINLFITLMNSLRNDPKKQANVMYDQDLNELHSKIIRLKPKVNKSLRIAIERYESFLEMNNKISTISRLYDQFLENKLNLAYGNHYISNPPAHQQQQQQQPAYHIFNELPSQGTGYSQSTAVQSEYRPFESSAYHEQTQAPQGTGGYQQGPQRTGEYQQAPQLSGGYQQAPHTTGEYQGNPQRTGEYPPQTQQYPQGPISTGYHEQANAYPSQPPKEQGNFYPTFPQESNSNDSFAKPISDQLPSEPKFDEENEESERRVPKFTYSQYPHSDQDIEAKVEQRQASYPTSDNYLPSEPSQKSENDYVTVSLPHYPPPEDLKQELPVQSFIRRASSSLPASALEDANAKFPTLENVEEEYDRSHKGIDKLPVLPSLDSFEEDKESEQASVNGGKRFVSEPEPLIDL